MNSTLTRTATPTAVRALRADVLVLPAAVGAPAALAPVAVMRAVDGPVSQETSAWSPIVDARTAAVAGAHVAASYAAKPVVAPAATSFRNATQGPPSRGTPV